MKDSLGKSGRVIRGSVLLLVLLVMTNWSENGAFQDTSINVFTL